MNKNNFDFLRFLFAFIVILSHIIDLSLFPDFLFLKKYFDTHLSVTGFFIISGFLIAGSYVKTQNIRKYFVKRAKRLLPAYLFIVIFSALFFSIFSSYNLYEYFTNSMLYKYIFANLFFVNFIQPCLPGVFLNNILCTINGALWTIKVEVSFYVILPLILLLINKFEKKIVVFISIYFLGLIYLLALYLANFIIPEKQGLLLILKHQLPGFLTYFISGISLFFYFDFYMKFKNKLAVISIIVFSVEYYFNLEILRPIAMSLLILYFAYGFKFLNNWGKYGDFSYGIYIYHFPIIQMVVSLNLFHKFNPFLVAFSIIITVFFLAFLSWNLLEKRFLKRI
jgi:peptidoglycan/LPS O-acetylase OafA/YrhL